MEDDSYGTGANPREQFAVFSSIPEKHWIQVEYYGGKQWEPLDAEDMDYLLQV